MNGNLVRVSGSSSYPGFELPRLYCTSIILTFLCFGLIITPFTMSVSLHSAVLFNLGGVMVKHKCY